jgi:hypothetical protein
MPPFSSDNVLTRRPQGGGARRVVLMAAGLVTGMLLAMFSSRTRRQNRRATAAANVKLALEAERLRLLILGSDRRTVAHSLGPPRTALLSSQSAPSLVPAPTGTWQADTWYYAVAPQWAMAIRFCPWRDAADEVELFRF